MTATLTELPSMILRDTLVYQLPGTNSTAAENQEAGHLLYAAWWTRQDDC